MSQLSDRPARSAPPSAAHVFVASHFDAEDKMLRIAGVYSSEEAASARIDELGSGSVQRLEIDSPIRFTFETDAGEERKDLARQGSDGSVSDATRAQASIPATSVAEDTNSIPFGERASARAGGSSEQVPAASDGFTGSREVREDARKSVYRR